MLLLRSAIRRGGRPVTVAVLAVAIAGLVSVPRAAGDPVDINITATVTGTLGSNGWYTSNVTVSWTVTATGSINSSGCDVKTLTVDTTGTGITCSAADVDIPPDSTASKTVTIKLDKTAPAATAAASRAADANGWYNHAVSVAFSGTDATSGIASCSSASYSGPDNASASVGGSCTDKAGNVGASSLPLKYDATPPVAAAATSRAADANGWYNHPLTVSFAGSDVTSGIASCTSASYSGPDNGSAAVGGSCTDKAGNVGVASLPLKYDSTPPVAAAAASRAADANGWYNHALTVSFAGSDVTSGIASCSSASYSGPDNASASVAGSCTDKAGNVGAASQPLKYDSTPPTVVAAGGGGRQPALRAEVVELGGHGERPGHAFAGPRTRGNKHDLQRSRQELPGCGAERRQGLPLHGDRLRPGRERRFRDGHGESDRPVAQSVAGRAGHVAAGSDMDAGRSCELLQPPDRPRKEDSQHLAAARLLPPSAILVLRRASLPARGRRVSLVRVAWLRAAVGGEVR